MNLSRMPGSQQNTPQQQENVPWRRRGHETPPNSWPTYSPKQQRPVELQKRTALNPANPYENATMHKATESNPSMVTYL